MVEVEGKRGWHADKEPFHDCDAQLLLRKVAQMHEHVRGGESL